MKTYTQRLIEVQDEAINALRQIKKPITCSDSGILSVLLKYSSDIWNYETGKISTTDAFDFQDENNNECYLLSVKLHGYKIEVVFLDSDGDVKETDIFTLPSIAICQVTDKVVSFLEKSLLTA